MNEGDFRIMYKLVCIDVDGTLLTSSKTVSKKTILTLRKAHEMGVHIVINTGRFLSSAAYYSQFLGVKSPVAALNGSIIMDNNSQKIMYRHPLKADIIEQLLDVCSRHSVRPIFYTDNTIYSGNSMINLFIYQLYLTGKLSSSSKVYLKNVSSHKKWMDIIEKNKNNFIKFEILSKNKKKIASAKEDLAKFSDIEAIDSNPYDIEVTAKDVSKGTAAGILADYFNIKKDEVMCIGDSLNDLSMIEYAGLGVAMGNADEYIKERASYVTDTNDNDGVAKAVDKFILSA